MFRYTLVVILSLAASLTGFCGWIGIWQSLYSDGSVGKTAFYLHTADGLLRLYAFSGNERIYLDPSGDRRFISLRRRSDDGRLMRFQHAVPPRIPAYAGYWRDTRLTSPGTQPVVYMYGLRVPIVLPVALLLAYPLWVTLRDRLRRMKGPQPGECKTCRYDLTGNRSGVCPECGSPVLANPT